MCFSPVDNFTFSFLSNHRQERVPQVRVYKRKADYLVTEDHKPKVVDIFNIVLLDVDTVLNHKA